MIVLTFPMPSIPRKTKPPKEVPPWSTNDGGRLHPMARWEKIKAWRNAAKDAAEELELDLPLDPSFVRCTLPFWTNTRRDPSNYTGSCHKAIVDGLVMAGLWPDDNGDWVTGIEPICSVMPKSERYVTIVISPRSEGFDL